MNRRAQPGSVGLRRYQRGQALTEFLVVALALIPLFLLVPMIGKYQSIATATQMASRYVAFDAMVNNNSVSHWKPEAQLADEVRRRFFSSPQAAIKTGDTPGDFKADQNPLWRDPLDQALIRSFKNDIHINFGESGDPGHEAGFRNAADNEPFLDYKLLSLKARGTYTAGVTVDIALLPGLSAYQPLDTIKLQMTRRTSVLIDHWTGLNPPDVQSHLDNVAINAGRILKPTQPIVDLAVFAAELPPWGDVPAPKLGQLDFWQDTLPPDRLYR